jgi:hypothetical protein
MAVTRSVRTSESAEEGYSYGIGGFDQWGCDVSRARHIRVHEYDCFDTTQLQCPGGQLIFHAECVGPQAEVVQRCGYDSMQGQVTKNGAASKHLVVKMDVEGAEWSSFAAAPDSVFDQIDQLVVEFHNSGQSRFRTVVARLKQHFLVAHIHFNNFACRTDEPPFPSDAFEVLFVSKRLGLVDASGSRSAGPAVDAPNNPQAPDCQGPVQ